MEHTALYRKYRPTEFSFVKNQEHIITVLEGAIKKAQIPHALLFCGSRGTGKTTVARIFASAIGVSDVDIYEIDAASNRGIDDVRELKEAVHTLPYESERKVYIIDEVHMLTKEAFNALLKTLEEPPAHVVFILATTERDKLLDTITSRCQVFTFRAPALSVLRDHIIEVAKKEQFTLTEGAADLIAVAADGSFRDALGTTQKVITASSDTKADADEVATIISAPKTALLLNLVEALHGSNTEAALEAVATATNDHVDMKLFMRLLLERIRTIILLRYQNTKSEELLAPYGDAEQTTLATIATDTKSSVNSHLLLRLLTAAEETGRTYLAQLPLELAVVELTQKKDG